MIQKKYNKKLTNLIMKKKGEIKTIKINQQELESLLYFLKFNKPFRYLDQKIFGKDIYKSYGGIY